jgi:dephospho-CoA kinase
MAAAPAGSVVVYDVPLLTETGRQGEFEVVVVVTATPQVRLRRLAERGLSEADARARIASQASDAQRLAVADEVVANDGDRAELAAAVAALWGRLVATAEAG